MMEFLKMLPHQARKLIYGSGILCPIPRADRGKEGKKSDLRHQSAYERCQIASVSPNPPNIDACAERRRRY